MSVAKVEIGEKRKSRLSFEKPGLTYISIRGGGKI